MKKLFYVLALLAALLLIACPVPENDSQMPDDTYPVPGPVEPADPVEPAESVIEIYLSTDIFNALSPISSMRFTVTGRAVRAVEKPLETAVAEDGGYLMGTISFKPDETVSYRADALGENGAVIDTRYGKILPTTEKKVKISKESIIAEGSVSISEEFQIKGFESFLITVFPADSDPKGKDERIYANNVPYEEGKPTLMPGLYDFLKSQVNVKIEFMSERHGGEGESPAVRSEAVEIVLGYENGKTEYILEPSMLPVVKRHVKLVMKPDLPLNTEMHPRVAGWKFYSDELSDGLGNRAEGESILNAGAPDTDIIVAEADMFPGTYQYEMAAMRSNIGQLGDTMSSRFSGSYTVPEGKGDVTVRLEPELKYFGKLTLVYYEPIPNGYYLGWSSKTDMDGYDRNFIIITAPAEDRLKGSIMIDSTTYKSISIQGNFTKKKWLIDSILLEPETEVKVKLKADGTYSVE